MYRTTVWQELCRVGIKFFYLINKLGSQKYVFSSILVQKYDLFKKNLKNLKKNCVIALLNWKVLENMMGNRIFAPREKIRDDKITVWQ